MDSTRIINLVASFDLRDFVVDIASCFDNWKFEPLLEEKTFTNHFSGDSRSYDASGNLIYIGRVVDGNFFLKTQKSKASGMDSASSISKRLKKPNTEDFSKMTKSEPTKW